MQGDRVIQVSDSPSREPLAEVLEVPDLSPREPVAALGADAGSTTHRETDREGEKQQAQRESLWASLGNGHAGAKRLTPYTGVSLLAKEGIARGIRYPLSSCLILIGGRLPVASFPSIRFGPDCQAPRRWQVRAGSVQSDSTIRASRSVLFDERRLPLNRLLTSLLLSFRTGSGEAISPTASSVSSGRYGIRLRKTHSTESL